MSEWADVEDQLVIWAEREIEGLTADTVTGDLDARMPLARFSKLGGPRDGITDYARVDIDVFARTRAQARDLIEEIVSGLLPRTRLSTAIIDNVRIDASPHLLPWDNDNVRRFGATCQISLRR